MSADHRWRSGVVSEGIHAKDPNEGTGRFLRTHSRRHIVKGASRQVRASLLALPLLAIVVAAMAPDSGASQVITAHKTPTQQGMSFYNGKSVTLITGGAPGAFIYSWATLLAPLMGTYLHAKISIEDIATGGSVGSENAIASAPPNGLTFGWMNLGSAVDLLVSGLPGLSFNPSALPYAGAVAPSTTVYVVNPNSPYKTFTNVLDSSTPVGTLDLVSGATDLALRGVYGAYGVTEKIVTGYSSTPALLAGFLRGDGPATLISVSTVDADLIGGQARALWKTSDVPTADPAAGALRNVPTLEKYVAANPPKTKTGLQAAQEVERVENLTDAFAFPKGTPQSDVDALGKAMQWAMSRRALKKAALALSLDPIFVSGPVAHKNLISALVDAGVVKPYLVS